MATASVIEAIGDASAPSMAATERINLLGTDVHSGGTATAFLDYPILSNSDGSPVRSMERWVRLQFTPPFNAVWGFRFWCEGLSLASGWTLKYGTADTYATPTNAVSAIATQSMLTARPDDPNIGGYTHLDGSVTRYSDWVVIQAIVSGDAYPGPISGFSGTDPVQIDHRFEWTQL